MSCCANEQDFCIAAGSTFHPVLRWASDELVSVPITAISKAAPVVITAPGHGMPNGWPCAVVSASGMFQINAGRYPPQASDWHKGTVVTADQVQINEISSADYTPYTSGGFLVYSRPMDLLGASANLQIFDNPDHTGTPLVFLVNPTGITIDQTAKTITPLLQTAGLTWETGYYTLDMTEATGVVTEVLRGIIRIDS